ncbi:hypothetical protein U27_02816 [Candidatus Vecturithrix granuli]|uniref:Uncharacterized protein n=1 Tax=Vecturithrix granuli TaxID=1499967 RepID=A0A081BU50_VECG1|nr:hypothetical protein U27_02816 [Candidatus Vecturithrix granuli]
MEALTTTKHELISLLQDTQFDHLSHKEQIRLREYLAQIVSTLQDVSERHRMQHTPQVSRH